MEARWGEIGRRILLGDNMSGVVVILRPVEFRCEIFSLLVLRSIWWQFLTDVRYSLSDWSSNPVGCSETSLINDRNTYVVSQNSADLLYFTAEVWTQTNFGVLDFGFQLDNLVYEVVTKIFRIDALKIMKLIIRPIGRHNPRSSSLPLVDIGPTVSFISGTLPGGPFPSEC
jgi:hypothetical protein